MAVRTLSQQKLSAAVYNKTKKTLGPRGSVYFDGNGDYLSLPITSSFSMGTGDFCIEYFARSATTFASTNIYAFDMATNGGVNGTRSQFFSNSLIWGPYAGTQLSVSVSGIAADTWHHYALVRSGSTLTAYIDGTSAGSVTNSSNLADTMLTIGQYNYTYGSGGWWNGYISNYRIVKGAPVYTANFTTPTAALTAISGTVVLTCQNPTTIVDNGPNAFTVTANGNAAASSTNPFP